jgi:hypothetical protein
MSLAEASRMRLRRRRTASTREWVLPAGSVRARGAIGWIHREGEDFGDTREVERIGERVEGGGENREREVAAN